MAIKLTQDEYLNLLREVDGTNNPFTDGKKFSARKGEAYAAMAHAIADFYDALRADDPDGFNEARQVLEDTVHSAPIDTGDGIPAGLAALLMSLGAVAISLDDDDEDDGSYSDGTEAAPAEEPDEISKLIDSAFDTKE